MKNFFSVGSQPIKILLNKSTTTVVMGANGSGKSSCMLDAIHFALFGKPFRDVNKPTIINSINQGDCLVELEFTVGSKDYLLKRGLKPAVFEIIENSKLIDQTAVRDYQGHLEDNILGGMNMSVFKQIIVMGSADYIPFMKLKADKRREIIEELLDITIFSKMLAIAKEKMKTLKETLSNSDKNIVLQEQIVSMHKKNLESLALKSADRKVLLDGRISYETKLIETSNESLSKYTAEKNSLLEKTKPFDAVKKATKELETLSYGFSSKKGNIETTLKFFNEHSDCPTCQQGISDGHKTNIVLSNETKLKDVDDSLQKIVAELAKKRKNITIFEKILTQVADIDRQIYQLQSNISTYQRNISSLQTEIKDLNQSNENEEQQLTLKTEEEKLLELKEERLVSIEERQYYELISGMLQDGGIKTKIISQYVPIMNKIINEYLIRFGLPIEFTLDEQFNESMKSRYRDVFQYNNFSEGEKSRIDISLLLAWRNIAKAKNTTNCNLLIFDEIFDGSLDATATDELLNILLEMDKNTNIFIISHKQDLSDKMRSMITFEKCGNFTRMVA